MAKKGLLSSLRFLKPLRRDQHCQTERLAAGWGEVRCGERDWEDFYRKRWQYDKKVRSTHGVNCTGSCSWDVYVKDGIIVWETQLSLFLQRKILVLGGLGLMGNTILQIMVLMPKWGKLIIMEQLKLL